MRVRIEKPRSHVALSIHCTPATTITTNPEDRQTCQNAKSFTSLLYLVIQYVEEGQPIVIKANDLPKMDFVTGKADPYVSVKLNADVDGKEKTRTIEANLDPQWDEDFLYQVEENSVWS